MRGRAAAAPQARWLTIALVAAGTIFTAINLVSVSARPGDLPITWAAWLLAPGMGAVLLLAGRRWPVAALVISAALLFGYYATGRPPIGFAILLVPAVVNAAERGRVRAAAIVGAGLLLVAFGVRLFALGQGSQILGNQLLTDAAVLVGGLAVGDALLFRNRWHAELGQRIALERTVHEREVEARVEAERRGVSRDIHDGMGHALVIIAQQASIARAVLGTDGERARAALDMIRSVARGARRDVDQVVAILRSPLERSRLPVPRFADVEVAIEALREAGTEVSLTRSGELGSVGALVEASATRLVQEALTNVQRHSRARRVDIAIVREPGRLRVGVVDDGGAAADWQPGSGITGMRERAILVNGEVTISAEPDRFEVAASYPCED